MTPTQKDMVGLRASLLRQPFLSLEVPDPFGHPKPLGRAELGAYTHAGLVVLGAPRGDRDAVGYTWAEFAAAVAWGLPVKDSLPLLPPGIVGDLDALEVLLALSYLEAP